MTMDLYDLINDLDQSWQNLLSDFVEGEDFAIINDKVFQAYRENTCYPDFKNIFQAFKYNKVQDIKVIILGQDPYHQPGQAHGLSFSVPKGIKIPPSLRNIYKEIWESKALNSIPNHGFLEAWAEQGVLLLNTALTVEANKANSHKNIPWKLFTDYCIQQLALEKHFKVFALWGGHAKSKHKLIQGEQNIVLEANHPSPLSANRGGWFGNDHFNLINEHLQLKNTNKINWNKITDNEQITIFD